MLSWLGQRGPRASLRFLAVALVAVGCGIHAPVYRPALGAGTPEVIVRPFGTRQASGGYTGPTNFGRLFAEYLAGALQEQGVRAVVAPPDEPLSPDVGYLIEGELARVHPGSWNLRFWIGFGAGAGRASFAARTRVTRVTDVLTNTHIFVFDETQEVGSTTWQFQESILRRCAASLARRVAAKIRAQVHF